jgi:hypothetical protein
MKRRATKSCCTSGSRRSILRHSPRVKIVALAAQRDFDEIAPSHVAPEIRRQDRTNPHRYSGRGSQRSKDVRYGPKVDIRRRGLACGQPSVTGNATLAFLKLDEGPTISDVSQRGMPIVIRTSSARLFTPIFS